MATYSRQSHVIYRTRYHLVCSTRFRRKILKGGVAEYLYAVSQSIPRRHPEIQILEMKSDLDHIHLVISVAPRMAISTAVRLYKTITARCLREKFTFLNQVYWDGKPGIWAVGYFLSTAGVTEKILKLYVEMQGQEDSGQAKLEL